MAKNNSSNLTHTQYNVVVGSTNNEVTSLAPSATTGIPLISQGASANPAYGTGVVAGGMTGNTTFTAYSVICAGTTATGVLQNVSGVGTSGQVLTSGGAATLPTWTTLSPATTTFIVTKYTASDTWTKGANTKVVEVVIWGGGGGGGSGRKGVSTNPGGGGGGGGGGAVHMIVPQEFFAATETVTIGGTAAGGTAQASSSTNGRDGTVGNNTSIGNVIALGGNFGSGGIAGTSSGGAQQSSYTFHTVHSSTLNAGGGGGTTIGQDGTSTSASNVGSGGGGGSGNNTDATFIGGGAGGALQTYLFTAFLAGGTLSTGTGTINGGNGNNYATGTSSRGWLAGSTGGGGSSANAAGTAGTAGNGGTPGGGGGGGAAGRNAVANSAAGGIGARGELWVIEYS